MADATDGVAEGEEGDASATLDTALTDLGLTKKKKKKKPKVSPPCQADTVFHSSALHTHFEEARAQKER